MPRTTRSATVRPMITNNVLAAAAALTSTLALVPSADAAPVKRKVCAKSAYLMESPAKGFFGTVFKGDVVTVKRASASGKWILVASKRNPRPGWVKESAFCG